jgi:hypothetical protein
VDIVTPCSSSFVCFWQSLLQLPRLTLAALISLASSNLLAFASAVMSDVAILPLIASCYSNMCCPVLSCPALTLRTLLILTVLLTCTRLILAVGYPAKFCFAKCSRTGCERNLVILRKKSPFSKISCFANSHFDETKRNEMAQKGTVEWTGEKYETK